MNHPRHHAPPRRAIAWALLAAALFGASTPLAKLWAAALPALQAAGLLYAGSGIGLGIWLLILGSGKTAPRWPDSAQWPWLLAAIGCGGVVAPVLLMLGLASVPASSAALLLNLEGVATATLAWWVFKEATDRRVMLGMVCVVLGSVALSWPGADLATRADTTGAVLIAAACLAWGLDNNLTRKVADLDPVLLAAAKGLIAACVNLTLAALVGAPMPDVNAALALMLIGWLGYGVSLVLFVLALRGLGAARTGAYFGLAPFMGAALGLALGDTPTAALLLAAGLMGVGLWLHLTEHHEHPHWHGDLLHSHPHYPDHEHQHKHPR